MGSEIVNRIKNNEIQGDFVGRDKITNIIMQEDSEREFVVTHSSNIKPVAYFTGREKELEDLRRRIGEGRKSVLVSGMGGIGKTHICRKLFEEYLNKHDGEGNGAFCHIGYVEYDGDMDSSLQRCLKYKVQDNPKENREAAWRELEYLASDGKLLLFVDNVDKTMGEDPSLEKLKGIPGAVILTSRQASISDEFESYRIGFLDKEQCKELYGRIRLEDSGGKVGQEEVQDLEYIIEKLAGRHTITIELLAHMARRKRWTTERLRKELEKKGFQLQFRRNGEVINIQKSYEVLYDLSKLTKAEQNILEAFSVFPYIPLEAETCNEWLLADAGVDEDDLMELYQQGWLQFDARQESYSMHPVFAQFIYEKCRPTYEMHYGLIEACDNYIKIPESGSTLGCQKFIPFAEKMIEKLDIGKDIKHVIFISDIARLLECVAEYDKAKELYKKALEISEGILGEEHPETATSYNNLAEIYVRKGEYDNAEELHKKSLEIREGIWGEEHPATATGYNNLACVYMLQEKYDKAEKLYKKSLAIRQGVWGEEHLVTSESYNNLAYVYMVREKYDKAEELYKKSLEIRAGIWGEEHPETATSYNNLAKVYVVQEKYDKAEKLYKKSLKINKRMFGEKHPAIALGYNNLAYMYQSKGEYDKAEKLYKKSLEIRKGVFGEKHPETAQSYNNLAYVYKSQGESKKMFDYFLKSFRILYSKYGLEFQKTQNAYMNLKLAYAERNPDGDFMQWLVEKIKE